MKKRIVLGWIAVGLSTLVTSIWAFWGTIENFHEGWYYPSLIQNIGLMFIQYLSLMLIFMVIAILAVRFPKFGGILYTIIGIAFCIWIILTRRAISASIILSWLPVTVPLVIIGILYFFGRPESRKLAYAIIIGLPLFVIIVCAAEPVYRISGRINDGNYEARLIEGNNVRLVWAPEGPGWPHKGGVDWEKAKQICQFLKEDGKTLSDTPQDVWRLPTVNEAVRSATRHGKNCGGIWDSNTYRAIYNIKPDKESPLWDSHSQVIYWWTSTEKDEDKAYIIVYHGRVYPRSKSQKMGSLGFRAVKEVLKKETTKMKWENTLMAYEEDRR